MGWEDRRYEPRDGGGGFRAVLRRVFGDGENFFDWAIPLYTAWGISVKLHITFVILIVVELIQSIRRSQMGLPYVAIGMGSLWLLVLLHEYGHCIACRRVRGTADRILLWPLGGLAYCSPPHHWKADLITTIGGPAVNAVLWPILGAMLMVMGQGWDAVLFNPFDPSHALGSLRPSHGNYWFVIALWWLYYTNALLFCFNMLLPMYPMDAGRILHAIMWRSMGHRRAMGISIQVGFVMAVIVAMVAISTSQTRLLGIAAFGAFYCYSEKRRLAMTTDEHPAMAGYDFDRGYQGMPGDEDDKAAEKAKQKRMKKEQDDQAELDRLLAKIAKTGMGSLSKSEKKWLEGASKRRRGGQ